MIPLALFLLGCVNVYLGTVEQAFSALMQLSLRLLAERNGRGARLSPYLEEPLRLFLPARLLTAFVVFVATVLLAELVGTAAPHAVAAVVVAMAAFVVVSGHVVPLLIVRRDPGRVLDVLLPSFAVVAAAVRPLTALLLTGIYAAGRDRAAPSPPAGGQEEEPGEMTAAYLEAGEQEGLIEGDERKLLQSIVEFGGTLVREVMTPRPDIVAIRGEATLDELLSLLREQEYSRVPVFKDGLDNILGVVFVKDLMHVDLRNASGAAVSTIMRPAYFVPETKRVPELLKEFQRQQVQIAIVVDEYGGTAGLVTIEDLLEEIVGEIRDEYDQESEPVTDEGNGVFVFSGKVNIDEVVERLETPIEQEGFETVGGYLLAHLGRVPAVGERFDVDGLSVEVLEAERRRVNKVRIRRRPPVPEG
jgi:putative hemolysin